MRNITEEMIDQAVAELLRRCDAFEMTSAATDAVLIGVAKACIANTVPGCEAEEFWL